MSEFFICSTRNHYENTLLIFAVITILTFIEYWMYYRDSQGL